MQVSNSKAYTWLVIYVTLVVCYLEFFVYWRQTYAWPELICGGLSDYNKILLVADPQILGENTESWIARWDSDRFIQKTFWLAYWYVKPSLVIFLGDLMDEGSIADEQQYQRYLERFNNIFHLESELKDKALFLPGDNDIGGENEEITYHKVNRFNKAFSYDEKPYILDNLEFIKVNVMMQSFSKVNTSGGNKTVRVVVSHMPLAKAIVLGLEALVDLKPHLVLSAHSHLSAHFVYDRKTGERIMTEKLYHNPMSKDLTPKWRYQLNYEYPNEILVPTCSYRMGVEALAYGVIIISKRKDDVACYYLLSLPNRLHDLKSYIFFSILAFIIWIVANCHILRTLSSAIFKLMCSRKYSIY